MGVFKRGKNFYIDYYAHGRRHKEKVGSIRSLAQKALEKKHTLITENKYLDIVREEKIKIDDFAQTFLSLHSKLHKKSWKSDEYNLKPLLACLGGKYLYQITVEDIEKYQADRIKEVKPATVNREMATLKTMLSKAVEWGRLRQSPAKGIKFLKEPLGRTRFLEKEEIEKFLLNCHGRFRAMMIIALNTGMRKGELLGLKWHDIDFHRDIIHLYETKNGDTRDIPMNVTVKKTLIAIPKHPESPYIFSGKDGQVHDPRKSFFTACKKAGIINFVFHSIRHTFASQLVMAGVDLNTVRELLGHKDIKMTLRYSHLSPDHKKRAVDVLSEQIGPVWAQDAKSKKAENSLITQVADSVKVK